MRKFRVVILAAGIAVSLAACGSEKQSESILQSETKQEEIKQEEAKQDEVSGSSDGEQARADAEQKNTLVVYFSQPETTDAKNMMRSLNSQARSRRIRRAQL